MFEKNVGGRPYKVIDQKMFEGMCQILCTQVEICSLLEVDTDTINTWCMRTYGAGFSDTYKRLSATGKMSIRRMQFQEAMKGNTAMLIFLGKTILKQSEFDEADDLPDFKLSYSIPDKEVDKIGSGENEA